MELSEIEEVPSGFTALTAAAIARKAIDRKNSKANERAGELLGAVLVNVKTEAGKGNFNTTFSLGSESRNVAFALIRRLNELGFHARFENGDGSSPYVCIDW